MYECEGLQRAPQGKQFCRTARTIICTRMDVLNSLLPYVQSCVVMKYCFHHYLCAQEVVRMICGMQGKSARSSYHIFHQRSPNQSQQSYVQGRRCTCAVDHEDSLFTKSPTREHSFFVAFQAETPLPVAVMFPNLDVLEDVGV